MTVGVRVSGINGKLPAFPLSLSVRLSTVLVLKALLGCLKALAVEIHLSIPALIYILRNPLPRSSLRVAWVRFLHPSPLGNALLTHGNSSGSSHHPEHHGTPLQHKASAFSPVTHPFLSTSGHNVAFRAKILVIPLWEKSKQGIGIKPEQSAFRKETVVTEGSAEPPTHLEQAVAIPCFGRA